MLLIVKTTSEGDDIVNDSWWNLDLYYSVEDLIDWVFYVIYKSFYRNNREINKKGNRKGKKCKVILRKKGMDKRGKVTMLLEFNLSNLNLEE